MKKFSRIKFIRLADNRGMYKGKTFEELLPEMREFHLKHGITNPGQAGQFVKQHPEIAPSIYPTSPHTTFQSTPTYGGKNYFHSGGGYPVWFGKDLLENYPQYLDFDNAVKVSRELAQRYGLRNAVDWANFKERPHYLPYDPRKEYPEFYQRGEWDNWLGRTPAATIEEKWNEFLPKAQQFVKQYGLNSATWIHKVRELRAMGDPLAMEMPLNPASKFGNENFALFGGWEAILGRLFRQNSLTQEQADEIRRIKKEQGISAIQIAKQFGISEAIVYNVLNNKIYKGIKKTRIPHQQAQIMAQQLAVQHGIKTIRQWKQFINDNASILPEEIQSLKNPYETYGSELMGGVMREYEDPETGNILGRSKQHGGSAAWLDREVGDKLPIKKKEKYNKEYVLSTFHNAAVLAHQLGISTPKEWRDSPQVPLGLKRPASMFTSSSSDLTFAEAGGWKAWLGLKEYIPSFMGKSQQKYIR